MADKLIVLAIEATSRDIIWAMVAADAPGVIRKDDWDFLGQRLSASNGISFDDVVVRNDQIIDNIGPEGTELPPHNTLAVLSFQLLFTNLYLGATEGALIKAAGYTRSQSRAWLHAEVEHAKDDPFVLNGYGEFASKLQATALLVDQASRALAWAYEQGTRLTARERGEVAALIASAKVLTTEVGLEVTSRVFDLVGARAANNKHGLDIFFRNVRAHSLHDPVAYKLNEVGRFFLNDEIPSPSWYR